MKNIIIAGASRSGKSTLAKQIAKKYKYTYIPFDSIVSTLEELYPCTNIAHHDENTKASKDISRLLETFIKHLSYENINYVIDMYQIYPVDLHKVIDKNTHLVLYFGYANLTAENKLNAIRAYARDKDWTKNTSDEEMITILNKFISEDKAMLDDCKEFAYEYFNTGFNFNKTIKAAAKYIQRNIR